MKQALFGILIIGLISQSCTRFEEEIKPWNWVNTQKYCFPDYDGKGFYLIDSRQFKYMMYYFSIDSNKWTAVSDGQGLPYQPLGNYFESLAFQTLYPDSAFP